MPEGVRMRISSLLVTVIAVLPLPEGVRNTIDRLGMQLVYHRYNGYADARTQSAGRGRLPAAFRRCLRSPPRHEFARRAGLGRTGDRAPDRGAPRHVTHAGARGRA